MSEAVDGVPWQPKMLLSHEFHAASGGSIVANFEESGAADHTDEKRLDYVAVPRHWSPGVHRAEFTWWKASPHNAQGADYVAKHRQQRRFQ